MFKQFCRRVCLIMMVSFIFFHEHAWSGSNSSSDKKTPSFLAKACDALYGAINPRISFTSPPPEEFFINPLKSFYELKDKTLVTLVSPQGMIGTYILLKGVVTRSDGGSDIYLNSPADQQLLEFTWEHHGRETAYAAVYNLNGARLSVSNMHAGDHNSILTTTMDTVIKQVIHTSGMQLLDLVHTHPGFEFLYQRGNSAGGRSSDLSDSDIAETIQISRSRPDFYVRIRAVLPNGYSYSQTFLNGERVFDPIYSKTDIGLETKQFLFHSKYPEIQINADIEKQIIASGNFLHFQKTASFANVMESVLSSIHIFPTDHPHYPLTLISIRSLLSQGHEESEVAKMVIDSVIAVRTSQILEELGVSMTDSDFFMKEKLAKTLMRLRQSDAQILNTFKQADANEKFIQCLGRPQKDP